MLEVHTPFISETDNSRASQAQLNLQKAPAPTYYQYREPAYTTGRMQLSILPEPDIDKYLGENFMEILFELGISDIYEFLRPPFTLTSSDINYINVTTVSTLWSRRMILKHWVLNST